MLGEWDLFKDCWLELADAFSFCPDDRLDWLLPRRCSMLLPLDTINGLDITDAEFLGVLVAEEVVVMVDGEECVR